MRSVFPGFPAEGLAFFSSLQRNNRREWFQPRKAIFEETLKQPMRDLVGAVNSAMKSFAPDYMTDPEKAIYRIYRDTRFSADKTPYKTHIAAVFPRRSREKHASAGFYCGVSLAEIEVAGGIYMPGPQELLAIRTWLAARHAEFRKAAAGPRKLMGALQGESLRRIPKGFDAAHPAADLLKMKQWLYYTTLDAGLITTPRLFGEIAKRFRAMMPVVELLNGPLKKPRVARYCALERRPATRS